MSRDLPGSSVGVDRNEKGDADMNDWKLGALAIVSLDPWSSEEPGSRSRRTSGKARTRPSSGHRVQRFIRRLFAAGSTTLSRQTLPQSDRRHLHPG
jgi:hypothetical protein